MQRDAMKPFLLRIREVQRPIFEAKCVEYRNRVTSGNLSPEDREDARHKGWVLQELLTAKEIRTDELFRRLHRKHSNELCVYFFERACLVIKDYLRTGGKNVHWGTGLPLAETMK